MGINLNLGKKIRIARKRKKLTQTQLAYKVHTTQQTICDYELGKVGTGRPDINLLFRIAKELDVSIQWLLKRD
jgi:transcriptional regulator with XRE-family HTH domain